MHDVSNAITILDPSKAIDAKICKDVPTSQNGDEPGKCAGKGSSGTDAKKLSEVMGVENKSEKLNKPDIVLSTVPHTVATISKDITALNRDQKGVVSSAL